MPTGSGLAGDRDALWTRIAAAGFPAEGREAREAVGYPARPSRFALFPVLKMGAPQKESLSA